MDLIFVEGVKALYKAGLVFLDTITDKLLQVKEFRRKKVSIVKNYR